MKIRAGFVSNSSSSSYTVILPVHDFEHVLHTIDIDYYRAIIREIVSKEKVIGIDCVVLSYFTGNHDNIEYFELSQELEERLKKDELEINEEKYHAICEYEQCVNESERGFVHSVDY